MKTAISVPDDIYQQVEEAARAHGMNRSEFYWRAAQALLGQLEEQERAAIAAIDAALSHAGGEADQETADVVALGRSALAHLTADDEW